MSAISASTQTLSCQCGLWTYVPRTVSCCLAALRQLRQIRQPVPAATIQRLVVALLHSRLDYGNGVLVGIPAHVMRRLQSVLTQKLTCHGASLVYHVHVLLNKLHN